MASLLQQARELFGSKDLYKVFDVPKAATQEKLRKAYYKLSLKVHPDKVAGADKSSAVKKFQLLCKFYKLLSDEKKRRIYDKTGELEEDDSFGLTDDKDWTDYWRELFPPISVDDIDEFKTKYKGSEEELSTLKDVYLSSKGDMQKIMETVLCSSADDEQRFRELLQPLIDSKDLPTYKKFTNESAASKKKRQTKTAKEAKEAEKAMKELKGGSLKGYNDLALALQRNKEKRGGILSYLEEKYAAPCDDDSSEDLVINPKVSKKRSSSDKTPVKSSGSRSKRQRKT